MALFPRIVEVELANSIELIKFSGLLMSWQLQRTADSRQPSGTISLYNLRSETERQIKDRYTDIRFSAGYPDRFGVILDGQIKDIKRVSDGLDRVAHVEVGGKAGQRFNPRARGRLSTIDISLEGPVPLETAVFLIASRMGLSVEPTTRIAELGIVLDDYASGMIPAHVVLDNLLTPHGLAWYEDTGGVIRFRKTGVVGVGKRGVLHVSEESGMIGKPGVTEDGLLLRTLIDHRAELDGLVQVRSRFYPEETAGQWKTVAIRNYGNSRDGEAVTEMDLRQVGIGPASVTVTGGLEV